MLTSANVTDTQISHIPNKTNDTNLYNISGHMDLPYTLLYD